MGRAGGKHKGLLLMESSLHGDGTWKRNQSSGWAGLVVADPGVQLLLLHLAFPCTVLTDSVSEPTKRLVSSSIHGR